MMKCPSLLKICLHQHPLPKPLALLRGLQMHQDHLHLRLKEHLRFRRSRLFLHLHRQDQIKRRGRVDFLLPFPELRSLLLHLVLKLARLHPHPLQDL